jgi:GNAT superfamily N-acetyltransferase
MNTIHFRAATLADSQSIASLHIESWRDAYRGILPDEYLAGPIADERTEFWRSRLSSPGAERRYTLLARSGGVSVGFACVLLDPEPSWGVLLDTLHVHPKLRGKGIGRQLFHKAASWIASVEPGWPMYLWVFEANLAARRFYDALNGEVAERVLRRTPAGTELASLRYVWRDLLIVPK